MSELRLVSNNGNDHKESLFARITLGSSSIPPTPQNYKHEHAVTLEKSIDQGLCVCLQSMTSSGIFLVLEVWKESNAG